MIKKHFDKNGESILQHFAFASPNTCAFFLVYKKFIMKHKETAK